ncbi:HipA family kinase [Stenotrophomonas rhizophila]|uniref:HipA family kinase n=1 Tax=Stenotrophomonas rhizophila TaxID=216778 RepID=UPI001FDA5128|nr:HipA family kinase [Stenotrophomonas rhizophila]
MVATAGETLEAWVKPVANMERLQVEAVCSLLGRSLGLPIPEPLFVLIGPEFGGPGVGFGSSAISHPNVAHWIDSSADIVKARLKNWPKIVDAACFDEWIANCDRHPGNLIHDGVDGFWLIDHDKAINSSIACDTLSPVNQLFSLIVEGASEEQLLSLQQTVGAAMYEMQGSSLETVVEGLALEAMGASLHQPIADWLISRQGHLMTFGNARVPAKQAGVV